MMTVSIGQYIPGKSYLHQLDPRTKLLLAVFQMILIFLFQSPWALLLYGLGIFFLIKLGHLPWRPLLQSLKAVVVLLVLAFGLNTLTGPEPYLWQWGWLHLSRSGLSLGLRMAVRLCLLILSTQVLLTLTTSPLAIADGMEKLFAPLSRWGFPSHELAMMMSIALRFVPALAEEADKIMRAQSSRGASYDSGRLGDRLRGLVAILVPLFASALKRADELATAMEARCYRGGEGRSKLHVLRYSRKDLVFTLGILAFSILVLVVEYVR